MTAATPRQVAERAALAIRGSFDMTEDTCYVAAVDILPDGAPVDLVIQVIVGGATTWEDGGRDGGQGGGELFRGQQFDFVHWFNVNLDVSQMSQEALIEETQGILDKVEATRTLLALTLLGLQNVPQPGRYVGESATTIEDWERGLFKKTLTMKFPYCVDLPSVDIINPTVWPGDYVFTFAGGGPFTLPPVDGTDNLWTTDTGGSSGQTLGISGQNWQFDSRVGTAHGLYVAKLDDNETPPTNFAAWTQTMTNIVTDYGAITAVAFSPI